MSRASAQQHPLQLIQLESGEGAAGAMVAQGGLRRSYNTPDTCLWEPELYGRVRKLLQRFGERALALPLAARHGLGTAVLPLADFLCSWWYPGPGIIQPGNQAVSLTSAPGRKIDYVFLLAAPC